MKRTQLFVKLFIPLLFYFLSFSVMLQAEPPKFQPCKNAKGKIGFCDSNGAVVIKHQFDEILPYSFYNSLIGKKNGKWGALDFQGKQIVEFKYDELYECAHFPDRFVAVSKNKYGIVGSHGKVIIPVIYSVSNKYETFIFDGPSHIAKTTLMALANPQGKYGVVDIDNRVFIPFEYSYIKVFMKYEEARGEFFDFAIAVKGKQVIYLDENRKARIIENAVDYLGHESEILFLRDKNNRIIFLDYSTKEIIDIKQKKGYEQPFTVSNRQGKIGLVTKEGKILLEPNYTTLSVGFTLPSGELLYSVEKDGKTGLISVTNKKYFDLRYQHIFQLCSTSSKLLAVYGSNDKFQVYHYNGKFNKISENFFSKQSCSPNNSVSLTQGNLVLDFDLTNGKLLKKN